MEDRTEYRINRLETEFEKLRAEFSRNSGARNLNLESDSKLVDSAAFWAITVIMLTLNLVVGLVALPLKRALAALCIIIGLAITAKVVAALRKRKQ